MKKQQILCYLLIAVMISGIFVSCAGEKDENSVTGKDTELSDSDISLDTELGATPVTDTNEEEEMLAGIPVEDFGGRTFNFISRRENHPEWDIWGNRDIYSEEQTGEIINDAVYIRNRYIEDTYNCVINEYQSFNMVNDLRRVVRAGDNVYDVALPPLNQGINLAADGILVNLSDISTLNLENKWWDQNANKSLSVANKLYYTSSDMLILNNDSTGALVFNKKLVQEHQLDDPYQLVKDGKWTYSSFFSQVKEVTADINGDGIMNREDKYGFMQYRDVLHCLFHGGGGDFGKKDENDIPYFTLDDEKSISILEQVFDMMNDPLNTYRLHMTYNEGITNAFVLAQTIFEANRALYYWLRLRDIEELRGMETDFGILPLPKLDETQSNYRATVNFHVSACIAIPNTNTELEATGLLLEALACKSRYTVQPAYYDIALNGKYTRDEESSEMLDIIFANRVYDTVLLGNFAGICGVIDSMVDQDNRNFTSEMERIRPRIERDIDLKIEKILDLD